MRKHLKYLITSLVLTDKLSHRGLQLFPFCEQSDESDYSDKSERSQNRKFLGQIWIGARLRDDDADEGDNDDSKIHLRRRKKLV